jgi:predicted  nucleic acid-binding Zn-ribbon protein
MTNPPEPDQPDRNKFIDRQFRTLDRRMTRLEATQITDKEINASFQQVYDELDEINEKIDRVDDRLISLESKIDTILQHLTGYQPGQ